MTGTLYLDDSAAVASLIRSGDDARRLWSCVSATIHMLEAGESQAADWIDDACVSESDLERVQAADYLDVLMVEWENHRPGDQKYWRSIMEGCDTITSGAGGTVMVLADAIRHAAEARLS